MYSHYTAQSDVPYKILIIYSRYYRLLIEVLSPYIHNMLEIIRYHNAIYLPLG